MFAPAPLSVILKLPFPAVIVTLLPLVLNVALFVVNTTEPVVVGIAINPD
jgi:hypothetical protein